MHTKWLLTISSMIILGTSLYASSASSSSSSSSSSTSTATSSSSTTYSSSSSTPFNAIDYLLEGDHLLNVAPRTKQCGAEYWTLVKTATQSKKSDGESDMRHLGLLVTNLENINADTKLVQDVKTKAVTHISLKKINNLSLFEPKLRAVVAAHASESDIALSPELEPLVVSALTTAIEINNETNKATYARNKASVDQMLHIIQMNEAELHAHLMTPLIHEKENLEGKVKASKDYLQAVKEKTRQTAATGIKGDENNQNTSKKQFAELMPLIQSLNVKIGTEQTAVKMQEQMIKRVDTLISQLTSLPFCRLM
ncbi:MAG: hypothetical protein K2X53_03375 [Alphaproteobacteria bacterium]|nr:hypothetical protein [Alphaproteobacteria bacterium]